MALLEMCNRVLSENGFREYAAIVGNDDPGAKQILALANSAVRSLVRDYDWPHLMVIIPTLAGVGFGGVQLPVDFKKVVLGGFYSTTSYRRLRSSFTAEDWARRAYGLMGSVLSYKFHIDWQTGVADVSHPAYVEYAPTPEPEDLILFYQSKYGVVTDVGGTNTPAEMFTDDTDETRMPEEVVELSLRWRFRRAKGLEYSAELAECKSTCAAQLAAYSTVDEIPVGGPLLPFDYLPYGTIPENGFGA
jgi:hypothetical protein